MADDMFRFGDKLGPDKILHIYKPSVNLKAIVVIDNIAAGAAIGGMRMALDVSVEECVRLARAMTLKNAAAGLPHGGAKSVIMADPYMDYSKKEELIRLFACEIRDVLDYIPGPDMGTDEASMAWIKDEIDRSVGLPAEIGGIPLDEIGATGFGLTVAAEVAQEFSDVRLEGARVVVQGFGSVGKHVARFLCERGSILVGASDSSGGISDSDGLDVKDLIAFKENGGKLREYSKGNKLDRDGIISVPCDIWIPAARPDVIHADNVSALDCKIFLQGANIPATAEAEIELHRRGVLVVPDFIANAGGVICAAVEYQGGTQSSAFSVIEEKLCSNTTEVLKAAQQQGINPRKAAMALARERVEKAMSLRRWY